MISKIVRANGSILQNVKSCTFSESVNAETNLKYGCVSASKIDVVCYGTQTDAVTAGEALTYYQIVGSTEKLIGTFYAEPAIPSRMTYSFTAYDAIAKLDTDFSAKLSALQSLFPMTVKALVTQAANVAGVTLGSTSWPNSTLPVKAFYADGITCREIFAWAAEAASNFVQCDANGDIIFRGFEIRNGYYIAPGVGQTGVQQNVAYKENGLTYGNYTFANVDGVAVHPTDDESLAYIYPTSVTTGNIVHIYGNMLLTDADESTYSAIAQTAYTAYQSLHYYRPFEVHLFPDENPYRAGDIVFAKDAQDVNFIGLVFSMSVNPSEAVLISTGNETYNEQTKQPTKDRLTNLAANIVRIKNLFVEQLEALVAQIDSLFTREITVTGSLHSDDYRQTASQPYAASGMAINFDTKEISAPYYAVDEYGNMFGNSAYFGDMYFADAMYGSGSAINIAPTGMKTASGATSTNYEAIRYLKPFPNAYDVRPGEIAALSGYQIGEDGTLIFSVSPRGRYLRFWALCDETAISELEVPHVKIYAVQQDQSLRLFDEFDLTQYGTFNMQIGGAQLIKAVPYFYYPRFPIADRSQYYQIEVTLPNATFASIDYAWGHYSAWYSYDNNHTYGGSGTYVGTDGISAQKIALGSTDITYPCGLNLLDNWYFVGGGSQLGDGVFPINQRGQKSYSGQIPAIDRWKLANAAASLTIPDSNDRIIVSSEGVTALYQDLVPSPLFGKTVTFSALAADNSLYSVTANVPETMPSGYVVLAQIYNKIRIATTGYFVRCQVYNGEWIAAKLEIGTVQTLAHQESGVWVLNELPDFVEELARCQRYMFAIGGIFRERAAFVGPNSIQFSIPCPPQFALAPSAGRISIDQSSNLTIAAINSAIAQTGFTISALGRSTLNPTIIVNAAKTSHGLTDAQICITTTANKVLFSVE